MKNKYDTIRQMIKTNGEQESSMPISIFLFIDFSSYKCTLQEVLGVLCISVAYNLRDNSCYNIVVNARELLALY